MHHLAIIIPKLTRICLFKLSQKSLCLEKSGCIWYAGKLRVCTEYFAGGKKTYENNVPGNKPIVFKERKSGNSLGFIEKKKQFNVDESIDMTVENESELSVMKHEKDVQMQEQKGTANISKVSSW